MCLCAALIDSPDPYGDHLEHIAEVLEYEMHCDYDDFDSYDSVYEDMGVFWDWCSIFQKDPSLFDAAEVYTDTYSPGIFGGAAYENSRTPEQKAAFKFALDDTMDLW